MSSSFADLGVSTAVVDALAAQGIERPFAIQRLVIGDVLAGRDVLAKSPTGSGKTLAFAVPLADRIPRSGAGPAALVLAPTRELAAQIVEDARPMVRARGLQIAAVYGGVGFEKQIRAARSAQIAGGDAGPARGPDGARRGVARRTSARSCSTRPTGCSTWASAPPSTASSARARPAVRRCSSRRRWTARRAA